MVEYPKAEQGRTSQLTISEPNKKTRLHWHCDALSLAKGKSFEGLRSVETSWKNVEYGKIVS